jgi:hypothetical protein
LPAIKVFSYFLAEEGNHRGFRARSGGHHHMLASNLACLASSSDLERIAFLIGFPGSRLDRGRQPDVLTLIMSMLDSFPDAESCRVLTTPYFSAHFRWPLARPSLPTYSPYSGPNVLSKGRWAVWQIRYSVVGTLSHVTYHIPVSYVL